MTDTAERAAIILSAQKWASNSDLIVSARDLGYLNGRVLDPTYGKGNWWKTWRPEQLTAHDLRLDAVDFRLLPEQAGSFDSVAFDPPYIPQGGRSSSTIQGFLDSYGLGGETGPQLDFGGDPCRA